MRVCLKCEKRPSSCTRPWKPRVVETDLTDDIHVEVSRLNKRPVPRYLVRCNFPAIFCGGDLVNLSGVATHAKNGVVIKLTADLSFL